MKEDKESSDRIYGAERGTAYHRVFELMDIENKEYSKDIITNMIQAQIDSKLLTKIQGEAVNPYDILKFTKTKVFERMAKAKESNQLYRERQFLLGVQAKEIKEHNPKAYDFLEATFPSSQYEWIETSHEAFKEATKQCKCIIRTGEASPYANIILRADCIFSDRP